MAKLMKADGTVTELAIAGDRPSLKELQEAVGGYIEVIRGPGDQMMVVNEDGKLRKLPRNEAATRLVMSEPGWRITRDDYIVGDVVLASEDDLEDEDDFEDDDDEDPEEEPEE